MKAFNSFVVSLMLLAAASSFAGGTEIGSGTLEIKCRADVSGFKMQMKYMDVVVTEVNGKISSTINGSRGNQDIKVENFKISPVALEVDVEDYDPTTGQLNYGELRIAQMNSYLKSDLAPAIWFHIPLEKIKAVTLYDLDGNSKENMFGGVVLVEAFDDHGDLLGRFISSMLPAQCDPL